jgi:lipid-A-disaccharide synthase
VRERLDAEALLVVPEHFSKEDLNELYGTLSPFVVTHDAHAALADSDFGFICSGTATLEASLIGTPFVLAYVAKPFDYLIARTLVKLDHIGLANIMFEHSEGRPLHPELIQDGVTAEALLREMHECDPAAFLEDAKKLRAYLGHGSSKRVAQLIEGKA